MNNLETLVYNVDFDLDCLEQYRRRNCLLLHGSFERDVCQTITILKNI